MRMSDALMVLDACFFRVVLRTIEAFLRCLCFDGQIFVLGGNISLSDVAWVLFGI